MSLLEGSWEGQMTNQELLERYIHAVKILLPLNKRDDIAAEIRSNLLSLMEDEEALLGRPLHAAEVGAILQRTGYPILVASRYRDVPIATIYRSGAVAAVLVYSAWRRAACDRDQYHRRGFCARQESLPGSAPDAAASGEQYLAGSNRSGGMDHGFVCRVGILSTGR